VPWSGASVWWVEIRPQPQALKWKPSWGLETSQKMSKHWSDKKVNFAAQGPSKQAQMGLWKRVQGESWSNDAVWGKTLQIVHRWFEIKIDWSQEGVRAKGKEGDYRFKQRGACWVKTFKTEEGCRGKTSTNRRVQKDYRLNRMERGRKEKWEKPESNEASWILAGNEGEEGG